MDESNVKELIQEKITISQDGITVSKPKDEDIDWESLEKEQNNEGGEEEKEEAPSKRRKLRGHERIRLKRQEADARAYAALKENENLKRKIFELSQENKKRQEMLLRQEAKDLEMRKELAKINIAKAATEGESMQLAEAQENLTEIGIELSKLKELEYHLNQQQTGDVYEPSQDEYVDEEGKEIFNEWLENNRWYEKSPELRQLANDISAQLDQTLILNDQEELIGTPEYYESITKAVKNQFQQEDRDDEKEVIRETSRYSPVTPVRRTASSFQPSSESIKLSPTERNFARSLFPKLLPEEAERRYIKVNYPKAASR